VKKIKNNKIKCPFLGLPNYCNCIVVDHCFCVGNKNCIMYSKLISVNIKRKNK
jgi:hypothetical protein